MAPQQKTTITSQTLLFIIFTVLLSGCGSVKKPVPKTINDKKPIQPINYGADSGSNHNQFLNRVESNIIRSEALAYFEKEEYAEADKLFEKSYKINKDILPIDAAIDVFHRGEIRSSKLNFKKALIFYKEAIDLDNSNPKYLNAYGLTLLKLGRYRQGLVFFQRAHALNLEKHPKDHIAIASGYFHIGITYNLLFESKKAIKHLEKSLNISQEISHYKNKAESLLGLGNAYHILENYELAISNYNKALTINKKHYGENHIETINNIKALGVTLRKTGNHKKGMFYLNQALRKSTNVIKEGNPVMISIRNSLALGYKDSGEHLKALDHFQISLENSKKTFGAKHPKTATTELNMGILFFETKDYTQSINYYEKALETFTQTLGTNHPRTLYATSYLAKAIQAKRLADSAEDKKEKSPIEAFQYQLP